ncbi:fibroblast growth factor receptor-like 1 [Penaeus monodon]|uniref:fibroblast growth factor receptor-like 1 n=1 Tax=Penaeus monodon TaxID=6687 RepID=UPI0018A744FB|nr:fibroblast growth factor receptor-like 1 [Penaeus monodon]
MASFSVAITLSLFLLAVSPFTLATGIKEPPRRTSQRDTEQKTVTAGDDVKFSCPIDGMPMPLYEWAKGGDLITEEGWERVKLQGRTLRIKEVTTTDQGTYVCTAINGFGKETFTFHLFVIDPLSASSSSSSAFPGGTPPEFTQLLPPLPGHVDKPVGHNVKLKCLASGVPEPTITWFKDGVELTDEELGGESRLTKHYLHLLNLTPMDSAIYTCAAANSVGAVTANWTVRVIGQARPREPEFNPQDPANTTVVEGSVATFQCSGTSEVTPHIKWLRRLEDGSSDGNYVHENQTITWKGHRYVVLQAAQVLTPGDGSFYTKLVIPRASMQDVGFYVCTVTNSYGLDYRQAYLSVITETSESNMLMLVVGLGCVAGLIVVIVIVMTVRRVQTSKPPPPPGPSEGALLPPPPMNQGKMQPPPAHHPRYVPQTAKHNSQQGTPHGHAVGPEGPLLQYAGGVVHLPPQSAMAGGGQGAQPIIVYQDPATAASVYIAQRPQAPAASVGRPEYQYQHLDVI